MTRNIFRIDIEQFICSCCMFGRIRKLPTL